MGTAAKKAVPKKTTDSIVLQHALLVTAEKRVIREIGDELKSNSYSGENNVTITRNSPPVWVGNYQKRPC